MRTNTRRKYKRHKDHSFGPWLGIYHRFLKRLKLSRHLRKKHAKAFYNRLDNVCLLLYFIESGIPVTSRHLARLLQVHEQTIKRMLDRLWEDVRVDVVWVPDHSKPGTGTYRVTEWGVLDYQKVITHVIKEYGFRELHKVLNARRAEEGLEPIPAK